MKPSVVYIKRPILLLFWGLLWVKQVWATPSLESMGATVASVNKECPLTVRPHVVEKLPGQGFNLILDIPSLKKLGCYKPSIACQIIVQADDGVTLLSSDDDLDLVSETRNARWMYTYTFALPGSSNRDKVLVSKKSNMAKEDTTFALQMVTDLCNPPANVNLKLSLVKTKGKTASKTCTENVKVAIAGGSKTKVDYTNKQSCALLGCQQCDSISSRCLKCLPSWRVNAEGTCECDSDAGTYLSTAYNQTLPSSKNGLSTIAPKDSCLHRIPNLSYRPDGFNPIMGVCNGSNPRVLQQLHVDPAECMCRTCPSNWTSDGGIPSRTACRPLVIPQYFLLEIEVTTSNLSPYRFNNSKQNDRTTLHSGRQIIEEIKERLLGKARHLDIQLYGPVVRRNIGGNTSIFSSIHSFKSYWKDQQREVNLLDSLKEHCFDLSSAAACQQCQAAIGVDICNAVKAAVGGSGITFSRLDLEYLDVPPGNLKPLRNPLQYDSILDSATTNSKRRLNDRHNEVATDYHGDPFPSANSILGRRAHGAANLNRRRPPHRRLNLEADITTSSISILPVIFNFMATNMKDNAKRAQLKHERKEFELAAYEDGLGRFKDKRIRIPSFDGPGYNIGGAFDIAFNSKFFLTLGLFCGVGSIAAKLLFGIFGGSSSSGDGGGGNNSAVTTDLQAILGAVGQINATVNLIESQVQSLQTELENVQQSIDTLQSIIEDRFQQVDAEISQSQCQTVQGYLQTTLQTVEEVYSVYCGISLSDGAVSVTATTITWQSQQLIAVLRNGGNVTYGEGAMYYNNINAFFNTVYGGGMGGGIALQAPLVNIILEFAEILIGSSDNPLKTSPLQTCAAAIFQKWQLPNQIKQAFDDRQYYNDINGWVTSLLSLQVQALQLSQSASQWVATQAYNAAAGGAIFADLPTDFCTQAISYYNSLGGRQGTSPLLAAYPGCYDLQQNTDNLYNYLVQQIEIAGAAVSFGFSGYGARLLLGPEITNVPTLLVPSPNGNTTAQNPTNFSGPGYQTIYLLAAGPAAFDPNCNYSNPTQARAAGCSVLGTFTSCGSGCGLDPQQEALWANVTPLGIYNSSYWFPANASIWSLLRGQLTNLLPAAADTGDNGDTMSLLESNTTVLNLNTVCGPFAGMMDRLYWFVNSTAQGYMQQIAMNSYTPDQNSYTTSYVLDQWQLVSTKNSQCNFNEALVSKQSNGSGINPFVFSPNITFPGAQCFAGYNPTNLAGPNVIGRAAGTSGVFCSYMDFPALWTQTCSYPGTYLCSDAYTCTATLNSNFTSLFGANYPLGNPGPLYSSCAWWPYEYGSASGVSTSACQSVSTSCPSQSQYYTGSTTYTATGYCALAGPPNSNWNNGATCMIAGINSTNYGITGFSYVAASCYPYFYNNQQYIQTSSPSYRYNQYGCPDVNNIDGTIGVSPAASPLFPLPISAVGDPWFGPMQNTCMAGFGSYFWFPNINSTDLQFWPNNMYQKPGGLSSSLYLYRLPVLNILQQQCTPSNFVNSTIFGSGPQPRYATWNPEVPTRCQNDLTQTIVGMIGSGYYTAPVPPNSSVTIYQSPSDPDIFFCNYTLGPTAPDYYGLTLNMTISSGPVFTNDDPIFDNSTSIFWSLNLTGITPNQPISLQQSLNSTLSRNWTRVLNCEISGVDPNTYFTFTLEAQPLVVTTYDGPAIPFNYPLNGTYVPSYPPAPPTPSPTSFPTTFPTPSPTPFPTVIPTLTTGPFTCTSCTVGTSGEFTTVTFPYAGVAGSIQVTQELYVDVVLVGGGGAGAPGNGLVGGGGGGGGGVGSGYLLLQPGINYIVWIQDNIPCGQGGNSTFIGGSISEIAYGGGAGGQNSFMGSCGGANGNESIVCNPIGGFGTLDYRANPGGNGSTAGGAGGGGGALEPGLSANNSDGGNGGQGTPNGAGGGGASANVAGAQGGEGGIGAGQGGSIPRTCTGGNGGFPGAGGGGCLLPGSCSLGGNGSLALQFTPPPPLTQRPTAVGQTYSPSLEPTHRPTRTSRPTQMPSNPPYPIFAITGNYTISTVGAYTLLSFLEGTATFSSDKMLIMQVLVVAGGGAAITTKLGVTGGGGGGGGVGEGQLTFQAGVTYTMTVGAGGESSKGFDSAITGGGISEIAFGGGATGASGGSSGGGNGLQDALNPIPATQGSGSNLTYYGNVGGVPFNGLVTGGSGGGGALAPGESSRSCNGGAGGPGYYWPISNAFYGGGGGGAAAVDSGGAYGEAGSSGIGGGGRGGYITNGGALVSPTEGDANTGGGGGGAAAGNLLVGGPGGGSGIVILAYITPATQSPTTSPSLSPSQVPTSAPTQGPSLLPSAKPTSIPTPAPTNNPTPGPSQQPTQPPTPAPSRDPTKTPSAKPSRIPSQVPSARPSQLPSAKPSRIPSQTPSARPSKLPSAMPSAKPSQVPSARPSKLPSAMPSAKPSQAPSARPSKLPSAMPSAKPSRIPSQVPSARPSQLPSAKPSAKPSQVPSARPSKLPSAMPSAKPSRIPSQMPSQDPTNPPTSIPSQQPTL